MASAIGATAISRVMRSDSIRCSTSSRSNRRCRRTVAPADAAANRLSRPRMCDGGVATWKRSSGPRPRAEHQSAVAKPMDRCVCRTALGRPVVPELKTRTTSSRSLVPATGADASAPVAGTSDLDEVVLVFSSGTTGLPKAVRHTHRSMGFATADWCSALGLGPDDRFQVATPPSHILGLLNLLAAASAGATVRLHRRFDLDEVLQRIESERMTLEMAVAPIALAMANHPGLERYDLSSLRYIMWGATPVSEHVARVVTERTGVRWLPAYGASELPVIACNPVDDPGSWRLDSAGLPPKGIELRVADLDSGVVLPPGDTGEIPVLSPSVMAGYLPEDETADAFADGWYRTGDVGWLEPDGWVHLEPVDLDHLLG